MPHQPTLFNINLHSISYKINFEPSVSAAQYLPTSFIYILSLKRSIHSYLLSIIYLHVLCTEIICVCTRIPVSMRGIIVANTADTGRYRYVGGRGSSGLITCRTHAHAAPTCTPHPSMCVYVTLFVTQAMLSLCFLCNRRLLSDKWSSFI